MKQHKATRKTASGLALDEQRWEAVCQRDRAADQMFVFGVMTTGVYCRPSCPARRPLRKNVRFFATVEEAERAGLRACFRCKPKDAQAGAGALVARLCRHIETNLDQPLTLHDLAAVARVSPFHLQRTFTRELGISPRQYADACRFATFKKGLRASNSVTEAIVEAGYSSPSRVYERVRRRLGMTPRKFRAGAAEEHLRYTVFDTELGRVALVAGDGGICALQFVDRQDAGRLRAEYPAALLVRDDRALAPAARHVRRLIAGQKSSSAIPLDIRGTAFQQRVWAELCRIPRGGTRTYSEVASTIGAPSATRAVARACATNPLAVLVPCHRVVGKDGTLTGYRWGLDRKGKLLEAESKP